MPRFAANLSLMSTELPFLERFAAAAQDGFQAVEYLFPYEHPAQVLADQLTANGLTQVLFNAPPGDWARGDRGIAAIVGREAEFRGGVRQALDYAQALRCPRVHVLAGIVPPGPDVAEALARYTDHLAWAAEQAAA